MINKFSRILFSDKKEQIFENSLTFTLCSHIILFERKEKIDGFSLFFHAIRAENLLFTKMSITFHQKESKRQFMVLLFRNVGDFKSTGYSTRLTFYFCHSMRALKRGCYCQTSEVNSELAKTPVGETEKGRKTAEHATDSSCQCPRPACPRKDQKNKKRKTKKSKINGIRNPALETDGSVFEESGPVSHPECGHYNHYQRKCSQSEKFQRGDGYEAGYKECCKSHGKFELDPEFIRGKAAALKLSQQLLGLEFVQAIFELDAENATPIFRSVCIYFLYFSETNPKSKLCLFDLGFLHGALEELRILTQGYFNRRRED